MDGKAAGSRKRLEIVCVLIVAGIVPLSGCAVPSTVAESIPAWMRPWQATPVAAAQNEIRPRPTWRLDRLHTTICEARIRSRIPR